MKNGGRVDHAEILVQASIALLYAYFCHCDYLYIFVFFQLFSEQSRREALNANKSLSLQAMRMVDTSLKVIDNMIVLESINSKALNDFSNHLPLAIPILIFKLFRSSRRLLIIIP